jgi:hypothetical protein
VGKQLVSFITCCCESSAPFLPSDVHEFTRGFSEVHVAQSFYFYVVFVGHDMSFPLCLTVVVCLPLEGFDWFFYFWCLMPLSAVFQLFHGDPTSEKKNFISLSYFSWLLNWHRQYAENCLFYLKNSTRKYSQIKLFPTGKKKPTLFLSLILQVTQLYINILWSSLLNMIWVLIFFYYWC